MLTRNEVRRKYDEIAPRYDRLEAVLEWLGVRRLRRGHFGKARGRVLEVAVGTGKNIPFFGRSVRELVGIDLSPAMMEVAEERAAGASFPVEFLEAGAEELPFADASFDTVVSSLSTCTFRDPVAALAEMRRVLRPDGRVLLLEHGRSDRRPVGWVQDRGADAHASVLGCRWNREPHELAEAAGLRVLPSTRRVFLGVFHVIEATRAPEPS